MKSVLSILFFTILMQLPAQSSEKLSLKSSAKTLIVELASMNKLILKNAVTKDEFVVEYENHSSYNRPQLYKKNEVIYLKVEEDKSVLPGAQKNKYRAGQSQFPNYTIAVPKEIEVKVVYRKGNFICDNFSGNLALYLDYGKLDLKNIKGTVFIQSYDGIINCQLQNSLIDVKTNKGVISCEIEDEKLLKTDFSLKGVYGAPINKLSVKTVQAKVNVQPLISQ